MKETIKPNEIQFLNNLNGKFNNEVNSDVGISYSMRDKPQLTTEPTQDFDFTHNG